MDYQPITYSVEIMGETYDLPARNLDVDSRIEKVGGLDRLYRSGKLTRLEVLETMHAFVRDLTPGALPPLEQVDTNELTIACVNIIEAYTLNPNRQRVEAQAEKIAGILRNALKAAGNQ